MNLLDIAPCPNPFCNSNNVEAAKYAIGLGNSTTWAWGPRVYAGACEYRVQCSCGVGDDIIHKRSKTKILAIERWNNGMSRVPLHLDHLNRK